MDVAGVVSYAAGFGVLAAIYAIFALGLNVQWGYTGLFNIGIAGFFALGAYTTAILTTAPPDPRLFEDFKFGGDLSEVWFLGLGIDGLRQLMSPKVRAQKLTRKAWGEKPARNRAGSRAGR